MPTALNYVPTSRWFRGRRIQRATIVVLFLASVLCTGIWGYRFAEQIARVREQDRWMNFTLPPGTIIFSVGHGDDLQLLADSGYRAIAVSKGALGQPTPVIRNPPSAQPWNSAATCAFLHKMRSKNGQWRLVNITVNLGLELSYPPTPNCELAARIYNPATLRIGSRREPVGLYPRPPLYLVAARPLRIFAGQPDPADESHFTIEYEIDGKFDAIDGWLMPDDTVKLEPRPMRKQ